MFDIASLDTATPAEQGQPMEIINPATGQPVTDANGVVQTITLLGRNSSKARDVQRRIQNRRMDAARRGKTKVDAEMLDAEGAEFLAACTVGWSFDTLGGQPFAFSEDNARRFWLDPRFKNIRDAADAFVADDGNFLPK